MNWGSMLKGAGALGAKALATTGSRTATGAALGALYGAMSDDTSVLGGALMGAGIARYAGAGFRAARGAGAGMGFRASIKDYTKRFGMGALARARLDYRGARMFTNKGYNKIKGLGFGGIFGPLGGIG